MPFAAEKPTVSMRAISPDMHDVRRTQDRLHLKVMVMRVSWDKSEFGLLLGLELG